MRRDSIKYNLLLWFVLLAFGSSSGCSSFLSSGSSSSKWPWSKSEEQKPLPTRILTIWTDAVHHQAGQKAKRGFGGRVVFYAEGERPIQVDGTLTIYVFADEAGRESASPERKFVFGAAELKRHYSTCSLGDSYSVWLPWDEVGGPARQLTLIARFDSSNGGTVMSDPAKKMLPGIAKRNEPSDAEATSSPTSISSEQSVSSEEHAGEWPPLPESSRSNDSTAPKVPAALPDAPAPSRAGRSIAEILREQDHGAIPLSKTVLPPDAPSGGVAQVGYHEEETEMNSSQPRESFRSSTARVETIQLGDLRSQANSIVNVPQHLLQSGSMDEAEVKLEHPSVSESESLETESVIQRTTVSYGTPGLRRDAFNPGEASVSQSIDSTDEPRHEPWQRRSRTMGSNRRTIAESRREAMQDRRPTP
ncbi:MAG: hypothetical protein JNL67_12970 [Planctomycetaceae bacterium]|nr:hypothetical protein [Planctomycetaceae bacterium]